MCLQSELQHQIQKFESIWCVNLDFRVSIHFGGNNLFGEKYLFHLSTASGIKYLGEIYKQYCCFGIFCTNSFDNFTNCMKFWYCWSLFPETALVFPKKFLNLMFDAIVKLGIINISCNRSKSYGSVVLDDYELNFGAGPQVQRDQGFASEGVLRLCTLLSLPHSFPDSNPLDYFVWSYVKNITNMTCHNTKASLIAAIRRVFAELPTALVEKACSQFRIRIEAVVEA